MTRIEKTSLFSFNEFKALVIILIQNKFVRILFKIKFYFRKVIKFKNKLF